MDGELSEIQIDEKSVSDLDEFNAARSQAHNRVEHLMNVRKQLLVKAADLLATARQIVSEMNEEFPEPEDE